MSETPAPPAEPAVFEPAVDSVVADESLPPNPPDADVLPAEPPAFSAFSASDQDVLPPELVYPQLRSGPEPMPAPNPTTPYFELVVSEAGSVERVQLHGPEPSLQQRMMVSAAKAWRFRPATRNGGAVRYVLLMPIPQ